MDEAKMNLDDSQAATVAEAVFAGIDNAQDPDAIKAIPSSILAGDFENGLNRNKPPAGKFPRLRFVLDATAVRQLLDDERRPFEETRGGLSLSPAIANDASGRFTTLEKLLYSILWKNGDLSKEKHLIAGILGETPATPEGLVFRRFGEYLSGNRRYILDQHTVRAYAVFEARHSSAEIRKARSMNILNGRNKQHQQWVNGYDQYMAATAGRLVKIHGGHSPFVLDTLYEIDLLLFGLGKMVKLGARARRG